MPSLHQTVANLLALAAGVAVLSACDRQEQAAPQAQQAESQQIEDPRLLPTSRAMERIGRDLELLVSRAEAAGKDVQQLVALRAEYRALVATARAELQEADRHLNPEDRRTLSAWYALKIGPPLGRLQPLLFPALLVDLPRGATPSLLPAVSTPSQGP